MNGSHSSERAKRVGQLIGGMNLVMIVVGIILGVVRQQIFQIDLNFLVAVAYGLLAWLVLTRRPRHPIGWFFIIIGFYSTMGLVLLPLADLGQFVGTISVEEIILWIGNVGWVPAIFLPITLVLQYFPDGRLPSKRWWPLAILTIMALLGFIVAFAFHPWPWEATGIDETGNPFGIAGGEQLLEGIFEFSSVAIRISVFGSMVAVLVRYRRSKGVERAQMKWLVFAAVVGISSIFLLEILPDQILTPTSGSDWLPTFEAIQEFIFSLLPVLFSITISIAILRHHLFDIDVIIRRTVQYTILTAVLALIYFGLVVTLQTFFSAVGGQESPIFIVISTLIIAGLFNPLRVRIQEIIDRRFYRRKYEAEQALEQFATAAQDEVDIEELSTALLGVVQETIQPKHLSLWLASSEMDGSQ